MCELLLKQEGIGVMVISCDNTLPLHYLVSHSFAAEEVFVHFILFAAFWANPTLPKCRLSHAHNRPSCVLC